MERLRFKLLGKPQLFLEATPLTGLKTRKSEALLYYLAVTGRPHTREVLADLLWGEMPEATARRNLTKALSELRREVGAYVEIGRRSVTLNLDAPYQLDVAAFETTLRASNTTQDLSALRQAIDLYQGDFLEGFFVNEAPTFEAWAAGERERLRELMLQALDALVSIYASHDEMDTAAGVDYAARLLAIEPWREAGHRHMMMLLARSGQRSAALAQYESCCRILQEELGVAPTAETTALYERIKSAGPPPPSNLPPQPNAFIGRQTELNQAATHLENPNCRLLTLVGPGGIGKTRLALQSAARYATAASLLHETSFGDGVYFVPLASVGSDLDVAQGNAAAATLRARFSRALCFAIAGALEFSFHGTADPTGQLLGYLRNGRMLLVLDNFEHLMQCVDLLARILQQAPGVKLLVTSRARLKLQEEWVIEIGGLAFPDAQNRPPTPVPGKEEGQPAPEPLSASELERYSAVALFVQRAQQIQSSFTLSDAEKPHVAQICRLVEGVPLALELAASWLHVLPCADIAQEIERNLDFLATSFHNIPPRHRSLRAVFEYSWQMLSGQEKELFCKLSLFRGGFQREAAEQISGASLATLAALVDKSLLRRAASGRYEIHELLRQYATEKLWVDISSGTQEEGEMALMMLEDDPAEAIWERYSTYYLEFVRRQEQRLYGRMPHHAAAVIREELDNIRRAWQWATIELKVTAIESSTRSLSRFYDVTGLFQEGEETFKMASDRLQAFLDATDAPLPREQIILGRLLAERARLLHRRSLPEPSIRLAQQATSLAIACQDASLEATARHQWGQALQYQGAFAAAQEQLTAALQLAQTVPLPAVEVRALRDLAIVAHQQGRYDQAQSTYNKALVIFRRKEDRRNEGVVLMNLGSVAYEKGRYGEARRKYEQALQIFGEIEDHWGETMVFNNLAVVIYDEGKYSEALATCYHTQRLCHQYHFYTQESHVFHTLGNILRDLGAFGQAQEQYTQSLLLWQEMGYRHGIAYLHADLSLLYHYLGDNERAVTYGRQARQLAQELGVRPTLALAHTYLGHALAALDSLQEAANAYEQALALRRELGEHRRAIGPLAGLAAVYLKQENKTEAQACVEELLPSLKESAPFDTRELFRIYLTCYCVLRAARDARAPALLETARRLLQEQAAGIEDGRLRRSFLENVPAHRRLADENDG